MTDSSSRCHWPHKLRRREWSSMLKRRALQLPFARGRLTITWTIKHGGLLHSPTISVREASGDAGVDYFGPVQQPSQAPL
jgi:hypothetical protein